MNSLIAKIKNKIFDNYVHIPLDKTSKADKFAFIDKNCSVGKHTFINSFTRIGKSNIGHFVSIGNNVGIGLGEHPFSHPSTSAHFINNPYERFTEKECILKNDVWVGSYAFIKRGVIIGNGAIIGAHTVVTKDVPDYAIVVGVPGKILKYRFEPEMIKFLLELKWWNWAEEKIKKNNKFFQLNLAQTSLEEVRQMITD